MITKTLDIDEPEDARFFLMHVLPEAINELGVKTDRVWLTSGKELKFVDMSDSEVVQYAAELLPMYQARFPDLVEIQYEH